MHIRKFVDEIIEHYDWEGKAKYFYSVANPRTKIEKQILQKTGFYERLGLTLLGQFHPNQEGNKGSL